MLNTVQLTWKFGLLGKAGSCLSRWCSIRHLQLPGEWYQRFMPFVLVNVWYLLSLLDLSRLASSKPIKQQYKLTQIQISARWMDVSTHTCNSYRKFMQLENISRFRKSLFQQILNLPLKLKLAVRIALFLVYWGSCTTCLSQYISSSPPRRYSHWNHARC